MTHSLGQHVERWEYARDGRAYWTREARTDLRYLAGKTWTDDERLVFESEDRRPTNYNIILPKMRLVAGIEASSRQDLKVYPRAPRDVETAEALTKIGAFVSDQNALDRQLSRAFWDGAGLGVGWLEVALNPDPYEEQVLIRRRSPFDIWIDPACREPDLADAQDVFRAAWIRPGELAARFPDHAEEIFGLVDRREDQELSHTRDYTSRYGDRPPVRSWNDEDYGQEPDYGGVDTARGLVRAVERWYRVQERAVVCRRRDGRVYRVTPETLQEVARLVVSGEASAPQRAIVHGIRVAIFAGDLLLQDAPSPYSHRAFPFVPLWGFDDEAGRPMGLIRQDRDPQKEYNSRRTNALKRALMRQLWYEKGAFESVDQALEAIGQHDGAVELVPGALTAGRAVLKDDLKSLQPELEAMEQARMMVQDWSGVTKELAGQESNSTSGVAIQSRAAQGQAAIFTLFDARNWAQQRVGELVLSLVQDTYTEEMAFRVTESNRGLNFVEINKRQADGTVLNDIAQGRYDVVVSGQPAAAVNRQQQFEALTNYLNGMPPEIKLAFAGEMAALADLPNAEEVTAKVEAIVERLLGGGPGPGTAPPGGPPSPHGPPEPPTGPPPGVIPFPRPA